MQSQGLVDMLINQYGGRLAQQLSTHLGVDEQTAQSAISIGIPLLMSALARNASSPSGAQSLTGALQRDHDGSILGQVGGLLSDPRMAQGNGIVQHALGGQRSQVEDSLSQATGVPGSQLLQTLAPLVMGQLGQLQRQHGLDANGMADVLGNEQQRIRQAPGGIGGLLSQILGGSNPGASAQQEMPRADRSEFGGTEV
jgi:hypothetical protein